MTHVLIALAGGILTFAVVYVVGMRLLRGFERLENKEEKETQ